MRKLKLCLITFLLVALMLSIIVCSEVSREHETPNFKIVIPFEKFEKYIRSSKKNRDLKKLYKDTIFNPIYNEFISGGRYSTLADPFIGSPIRQIDDLEYKLGLLKKYEVEKIVKESLNRSNMILPGVDTIVYIFPNTSDYSYITEQMGGVAGVTLGSGKILILLDPTNDDWKSILPYTVAHEYHHSIWTAKECEFDGTLLANMVFEGKADSFANKVFPEANVPWVCSIDLETEKRVWNLIKSKIDTISDKMTSSSVMYGDNKDFPHWSGYTIGYNIVQEFLKNNPDIGVDSWTKMDSAEIFKLSGYEK